MAKAGGRACTLGGGGWAAGHPQGRAPGVHPAWPERGWEGVGSDAAASVVRRSCKLIFKGQETVKAHVLVDPFWGQFITLHKACWKRQDARVYVDEWELLSIKSGEPRRKQPPLQPERGRRLWKRAPLRCLPSTMPSRGPAATASPGHPNPGKHSQVTRGCLGAGQCSLCPDILQPRFDDREVSRRQTFVVMLIMKNSKLEWIQQIQKALKD
uniref:Uncharacterized protein n=1 Tax=Rangifer tarandus platyrhynchus TaxID=3082113 RepID=A0ACB0FFJ4_RANTA|nr:unnamed protein product [Rangifer tarandus platyrhynchus]